MIKRNVLLNPGPATTTDTVKMAQVVPDICPREKEFVAIMRELEEGLLRVVHADPEEYAAVLFCGSGTINMDICLNSLLPADKKVLIINNGAYSSRAVEICEYYQLPHIDLKLPLDRQPDLSVIEKALKENPDIALVYTTHQETGTGLLNPIREIGALVHRYQGVFVVDTTSTYAMRPINIEEDEVDFCMASAQKGIMAMTGLSFIIGKKSILEASAGYPKRSYYCNLYMQYEYAKLHGEMHFTPPVQIIFVSGACGRLMCCLKYEQAAYEDLLRSTPKAGAIVQTPDGRGRVTEVNLLTGDLKVHLDHAEEGTVAYYHKSQVKTLRDGRIAVEKAEADELKDLEG